eukprot:COSAG02_NODE_441_length_22281_cov_6.119556_2_plen_63_part_00
MGKRPRSSNFTQIQVATRVEGKVQKWVQGSLQLTNGRHHVHRHIRINRLDFVRLGGRRTLGR